MRPNLVSMLDGTDVAAAVLPDLELLSAWANVLHGHVPQGATHLGPTAVQQQFARAMCTELALRVAQQRDASPPTWFTAPCASLDAHLVDTDDNPFKQAILTTAEMADVFEAKLTEVVDTLNTNFLNATVRVVSLVDSADGASRAYDTSARNFVDSFTKVAEIFDRTRAYVNEMATVFTLLDGA